MNGKTLWIVGLASLSAMLIFLLGIIGINSAGGFPGIFARLSPVAPTVAALAGAFSALVAAVALAVSAVSNYRNWRRQTRHATIQAWTDWSKSTRTSMRLIRQQLGAFPVTSEQARALTAREAFKTNKQVEIKAEESLILYRAIVEVLNGLERLAIGIERGVYDAQTVREMGATIVVRNYKLFENYINYKHQSSEKDERQKRAYIALSRLVIDFQKHDLDQDRIANFERKKR